MSDLAEQSRLHDRFAEMCRPVAADYAKGTIDRQTAVDRMEQRRSFLNVDPHAGGVIINSQLNGAETERKIRAKIGGRPNGQAPAGYAPHRITLNSGAALLDENLPPMKWILPGFIPEGCSVLASKPKLGKSHLIVALSYAVCTGGMFLERQCEKRGVLYLSLEGGKRVLQQNMKKTAPEWPDNFYYDLQVANLDHGGIEDLAHILAANPHIGLVFIDTLARIKGAQRKGEQDYQYEYRTISTFADLCSETARSAVLIHHARKSASPTDVFDEVLGSTGITGAADHVMVMANTEHGTRLYGKGREAEEFDKILDADLSSNTWTLIGDYEPDPQAANTRQKIIATLIATKYPMKTKDIAEAVGLPPGTVGRMLRRLSGSRKIKKTAHGTYTYV